jgi:hypothetical protein
MGEAKRRKKSDETVVDAVIEGLLVGKDPNTGQVVGTGARIKTAADEIYVVVAKADEPRRTLLALYYVEALDIYGLFDVPDEWRCVGSEQFVRNLPDGHWVWFGDLPEETYKALMARASLSGSNRSSPDVPGRRPEARPVRRRITPLWAILADPPWRFEPYIVRAN